MLNVNTFSGRGTGTSTKSTRQWNIHKDSFTDIVRYRNKILNVLHFSVYDGSDGAVFDHISI